MATNGDLNEVLGVSYDREADILTFSFTKDAQPGVAEEAADEVWVRYNVDTGRVITLDVLNFSTRVHAAFGPELIYVERDDPQRLESLEVFQALQPGR